MWWQWWHHHIVDFKLRKEVHVDIVS
jgi:hypothetical protein